MLRAHIYTTFAVNVWLTFPQNMLFNENSTRRLTFFYLLLFRHLQLLLYISLVFSVFYTYLSLATILETLLGRWPVHSRSSRPLKSAADISHCSEYVCSRSKIVLQHMIRVQHNAISPYILYSATLDVLLML